MNALVAPAPTPNILQQLRDAGVFSQVWAMALLTAAIAAGLWAFFWLQKPPMTVLQGGLDVATSAEVADLLRSSQIPFEIDQATGEVKVPGERLQEARMAMATAGIAAAEGPGMSLIEKDPGFGVSQFVETARYQRALETELARTVKQLRPIRAARIHLALPRPSAFTRQQQPAAASVVVGLLPGRFLEANEVAAIQHLVASSIPNLTPERVTVVDESGRLLTRNDGNSAEAASAEQFALTREKEHSITTKIAELLEPLVGVGRIRSQVAVDMDFSQVEEARESFSPESGQLRSEQVNEQSRTDGAPSDGGIPGATSNTPPDGAANGAPGGTGAGAGAGEASSSRTRNFELDRTLTHTRQPVGRLRRVTAAVVVDNVPNIAPAAAATTDGEAAAEGEEGEAAAAAPFRALTPEELLQIETLVKQAIGFNEARGDVVTVVNAPFISPEPLVAEEAPIWENPLVWQIGRIAIGALLVLLVVFMVLRPALRQLLAPVTRSAGRDDEAYAGAQALPPGSGGGNATSSDGKPGTQMTLADMKDAVGPALPQPGTYEARLENARQAAKEDPRLVAQVVKEWIGNDG